MSTPNEALSYAKRLLGNLPIDDADLKLRLLNDAHRKLWMSAYWPWTVGMLEVVTLINDTQDYSLANTSDFLGLAHVSQTDGQSKCDVEISSVLPSTNIIKGRISQVAYIAETPQKLRFLPVPTSYTSLPRILSVYKKVATALTLTTTANNYETTVGMPDEYFWVYQEIVLLKAMQFSHDPRLGSITVSPQGLQFTGQFAVVQEGILTMIKNEERFLDSLGKPVVLGD